MHYFNTAKMLRLLRFRSGFAAELPENNALNFAAAVFVWCFIAHKPSCLSVRKNNPPAANGKWVVCFTALYLKSRAAAVRSLRRCGNG